MTRLGWWMRLVGVFYVAQSVGMAVIRAPIRSFGPEGAIDQLRAGDPVAGFLADTWFTFGLEVGTIGLLLLVASRSPERWRALVWTVIAIEAVRGILNDVVFIARGIEVAGYLVWIAIHAVVILTGLAALRAPVRQDAPATA